MTITLLVVALVLALWAAVCRVMKGRAPLWIALFAYIVAFVVSFSYRDSEAHWRHGARAALRQFVAMTGLTLLLASPVLYWLSSPPMQVVLCLNVVGVSTLWFVVQDGLVSGNHWSYFPVGLALIVLMLYTMTMSMLGPLIEHQPRYWQLSVAACWLLLLAMVYKEPYLAARRARQAIREKNRASWSWN